MLLLLGGMTPLCTLSTAGFSSSMNSAASELAVSFAVVHSDVAVFENHDQPACDHFDASLPLCTPSRMFACRLGSASVARTFSTPLPMLSVMLSVILDSLIVFMTLLPTSVSVFVRLLSESSANLVRSLSCDSSVFAGVEPRD